MKKKITFIVLTILVFFGCAFGAINMYDNIRQQGEKELANTNLYPRVEDVILRMILPIDQQLSDVPVEDVAKTYLSLSFMDSNTDYVNEYLYFVSIFNDEFSNWQNLFLDESNYYYAVNLETGKTLSTQGIHSDQPDISHIFEDESIQDDFIWYAKVSFDEEGNVTLMTSQEQFHNTLDLQSLISDIFAGTWATYGEDTGVYASINPPTNIEITFAVPKNGGSLVDYYSYPMYTRINPMNDNIAGMLSLMAVGLCIVTGLYMLIYPIRIVEEIQPYRTLKRIKGEVYLFVMPMVIMGVFVILGHLSENMIMQDVNLYNGIREYGFDPQRILPPLAILLWMLLFFLFTLCVYIVKYAFHIRLKNYFWNHTCLGWFFRACKNGMNAVIQFDMHDSVNQTLIKILGVNFIIIVGISFFFVFGIIWAIIYTIILFFILKNRFVSIRNDYQVLLDATQRLSNGDFDIQIDQDLGLFNSLRDEFSNIRDGFEKAVNEEVKSQKMKTELISNVSHDLKTPLTSIITYLDLLKNPDATYDEKKEYMGVIERNTSRLKSLIEDLFEVTKVNTGNITLDLVDMNIISLVQQVYFECQDALDANDLDVRITCSEEKILCHLDSSKTYRIFENLLMNISKYALPQSRVYIDISKLENEVVLTFRNISKDEMHFDGTEIVERFVQGDKSRNAKGSGLGLAIAKSFTEVQQGTFNVVIDGDLFKVIVVFPTIEEVKEPEEGI
ncbi:Alkaline phosphatase synthesis sensor protein PhoR [Clostridiales bacterium CHKCI006]|nr:Alkaline phosphatase synthesis sensor protein PhoR [Clostridiales bacterium CHKCI006]